MSIYVDGLRQCVMNKNWRHQTSCHLFADTAEELLEFAGKIGLKPGWFQNKKRFPHYDLTEGMRRKAVAAGAVEVDAHFMAGYIEGMKGKKI